MRVDPPRLAFRQGRLLVSGVGAREAGLELGAAPPFGAANGGHVELDAHHYRELVLALRQRKLEFADLARDYREIPFRQVRPRESFPHQTRALEAWWRLGKGKGIVVLPTGSGKSHVGVLAIERAGRSALVVVPTLELVAQWAGALAFALGQDVGRYSCEEKDLRDLTVTTYASFTRLANSVGNRFGLVVFDECHHLSGPGARAAARGFLAPFRLGLTATPGDAAELHAVGPIVLSIGISELPSILAEYEVERIRVELTIAEREEHDRERAVYLSYLETSGIELGSAGGWKGFLRRASRSRAGREAIAAHRRQKAIAEGALAKMQVLEELLHRHRSERAIVFTADNDTAYRISRALLVPALTHQTPREERRALFACFREGSLPVLVTSRVLNEGIDVAEASVAVVWSGTGSAREHVQRLGRILRKSGEKRAFLYELVTRETCEEGVSARRRRHPAYAERRASAPPGGST